MLITERLDVDVIMIHGKKEKHDKFGFIKLFTRALFIDKYGPRFCISTACANTGIDKETIEMVICMGIPRNVVTLFQERGWNARQDGMTGVYNITTNWTMFVKLIFVNADGTMHSGVSGI